MEQSVQKIKSTDERLIQSYLDTQDAVYFNLLYTRYASKVYQKCISLLKNETAAQDATQDVFLKIFLNLSKFKGKSKFSTWVYSITYNYCLDLLKKEKRNKHILSDDFDETFDIAEELPDRTLFEMKVKELRIVLDQIPVGDKAILLMKYQSNLSIKDIVDILGKSEDAVKMQLKRAKHKVQKEFKARKFSRMSIVKSTNETLQFA